MVELKNVSFGYGSGDTVLQAFSLILPDGGRICLHGASGRGKTTILRLVMGLERPKRGDIFHAPGMKISAVFQEDRLLPEKTVLENVALFSNVKQAKEVLCKLNMEEYLHEYPANLSGGQKRRVALARALAHPFDLLILDEAMTGLDRDSRIRCLAVVDEMVGDRCLLMASHDLQEAESLRAQVVEW